MKTMIVVLLFCVVGCASTTYTSATKNEQQFYQDSSMCQSRSTIYVPYMGQMLPTTNGRLYDQCMRGEGWTHAAV